MNRALAVTILYPHPSVPGGVVEFIETMRRTLNHRIATTQFVVGSRPTDRSALGAILRPIWDTVRLVAHVLRVRPDVIHINPSLDHKSLFRDGLFLLALRLLRKREVLLFIHAWEESLAATIAARAIWRTLYRYVYGWPMRIIVLAEKVRDQMLDMGFPADRVQIESTMFDDAMFDGIIRRPHGDTRILFLSRLVESKGIFELLEAYHQIKSLHPEAVLTIAGDGPAEQRLKDEVARRGTSGVVFSGYLRGRNKAQTLIDSDVFVLPSRGEGCPVSLLEAMAAGLPCVVSAVGGIQDIFQNGKNGILVGSVNVDELVRALDIMLSDAERRKRVGDYNRGEAWIKYDARSVTKRMDQRYFEMAYGHW